jgi:hypothetical protein
MKKLFITLALACATLPALAQHHGHGFRHHGHHYRGPGIGWWVAPVVIGAIGYELGRQQQVIVQQPPIIVQSQPVLQQPPFGYHWEEMIDPATNTRKIVLVPN